MKDAFFTIKKEIVFWINNSLLKDQQIRLAIFEEENTEEMYRIAFKFTNTVVEILIDQPIFAPYRYFSLQVLALWRFRIMKLI